MTPDDSQCYALAFMKTKRTKKKLSHRMVRMGRTGPRETQVMIRLTEDERTELEDRAVAAGMPMASWVRHVALTKAREQAKVERA